PLPDSGLLRLGAGACRTAEKTAQSHPYAARRSGDALTHVPPCSSDHAIIKNSTSGFLKSACDGLNAAHPSLAAAPGLATRPPPPPAVKSPDPTIPLTQPCVMTAAFNLNEHELTVTNVYRNLSPSALYEHAIRYEK